MIRRMIFAACAVGAALSMAGAASAAPNLIINGDFDDATVVGAPVGSAGDGFTSQYVYKTPGFNAVFDEGTFTIAADPNSVHQYWKPAAEGSTNNLLLVNGDDTSSTPFVYTSNPVAATAGSYHYSFDVASVCCNNTFKGTNTTPTINYLYSVDGGLSFTLLGSFAPTSTTDDSKVSFQTVSGNFNISSLPGAFEFRLTNNTDASSGNDFAIDNISVSAAPEPSSWALMIAGVGFMGFALRTSRRRGTTNRFA